MASRREANDSSRSSDLDTMLRVRLEELKLRRKEVSKNSASVNRIKNVIVEHLKSVEPHSRWEFVNVGSYYDRTKILHPDEFDLMLVCEMHVAPEYSETGDNAVFCSLRSISANPDEMKHLTNTQSNGSEYVCPLRFKHHFSTMLQTALQKQMNDELKGLKIMLQMKGPLSAAMTFRVQQEGKDSYSFDIVPAVKLRDWPKPAKRWNCRWNLEIDEEIKHPYNSGVYSCAVARIHPKEAKKAQSDGPCLLWRISFAAAEKLIIRRANEPRGDVCRKDVLKLLKGDLKDFKSDSVPDGDHLVFGSYHLKLIFMKLLDEKPDEEFWVKENMRQCYTHALLKVISSLKEERVSHYFISCVNVLDVKTVWKRRYIALLRFFESQHKIYTAGL